VHRFKQRFYLLFVRNKFYLCNQFHTQIYNISSIETNTKKKKIGNSSATLKKIVDKFELFIKFVKLQNIVAKKS